MTLVGQNHVAYQAVFGELLTRLELVSDLARDGDDRSVASAARTEWPRLVTGLRALVEQHSPDRTGHCTICRGGRWWRRAPLPCRVLLTFQLATDAPLPHRPKHRLR
jgi:hypothetical protein